MASLAGRLPPKLRQMTSFQMTWAVLALVWGSLMAAWQWPLLQLSDQGILAIAPGFVVYLLVLTLGIGGFLAMTGLPRERTVESKNIGRIARLDHLRFFAASLVILYHYFGKIIPFDQNRRNIVFNMMTEGSSGVDIFFVLSGFIFGMIGYEKKIRYFDFIRSRVVRIYPLYLFAILLILGTHAERFLPLDSVLLLFPIFIVGYLFALPGFGQLWTIGLEFQFYLIFPFLAAFLNRNGYRYLIGVLALAIGLRALYYTELGSVKNLSYGSLPGRIDQFLMGIAAAWLYIRKREAFSNPLNLLVGAALALASFQWLVAWNAVGTGTNSPLWIVWPTINGTVWAYFVLSYISCRVPIPSFLDRTLTNLGALSFSLYVMHNFAVDWSLKYAASLTITGQPDTDAALKGLFICIPFAVLISWATYHLIEKQFFIYRRKYVEPIEAST